MRSRLHLIIYLALLLFPVFAWAQRNSDRLIYDEAEKEYKIGRIEQAKTLLLNNMSSFELNLKESAYRLLTLCYLGEDNVEEAEKAAALLLQQDPYYSVSPQDPIRFVDIIERIKTGLSATITTASSQAETLSEVPVPVTLITEEMIRNSSARNLQEVLATYVPGMSIIDCNDDINIAMRGIYSNGQEKILIMLNGHRLNSYCTNIASPDFSISLEKIKQIEVLRGPASSLYGGVALTAVVNLITKQGVDVNGVKVKGGIGNYGQLRGDILLGKHYFDLDLLVWGSIYQAKGQDYHVDYQETGIGLEGGDVTVGGIGPKPTYDIGLQLKFRNLQFFYNSRFSQVISPMSMTYTFSPYTLDKYRTYNGIVPSFASQSHHVDLNYSRQLGKFFLKGGINYDNNDLTNYQVMSEPQLYAMIDILPAPDAVKEIINGHGGISRYINGQEHTIGGKLQGDWSYVNNSSHKGLLSLGAEYSYFQLDDVRYAFGYDFTQTVPETYTIPELGKGHENSMNGYTQLKHQWRSFIVNAGLRFDYKRRYDDSEIKEFSPRLALIYVQPKWNLKLSYSKAFIDPPYLYRKANLFFASLQQDMRTSIELTPESFYSYQLTLAGTQWVPGLNLELNAFYNQARDLIFLEIYEHLNTGRMNTYGFELTGSYERKRFSANLNCTWQKTPKLRLFSFNVDHALNTPTFMANTVLAWRATKNLQLHTHADFKTKQKAFFFDIINYIVYLGTINQMTSMYERYKDNMTEEVLEYISHLNELANQQIKEIPVYNDVAARVLFDLGAKYTLGKIELGFDVKNVFNTKYKQSGMSTGLLPQRGRWFTFDVALKF